MRVALLLSLLTLAALAQAEPVRVFASVLPIKTFVEKVGGEHVDARSMVRPGYSPHTYEPTPQQIAALAGTRLYVRTGLPFEEPWMPRIRSANPAMEVLDARSGMALRTLEAHDHDEDHHGHEHGHHDHGHAKHQHRHGKTQAHGTDEPDPHLWTSPPLAARIAERIRDRLSALDPANAADYERNYRTFAAELETLDAEIHALLDPLKHRRFMVFHPAWGYFADNYGLTQVPIEREGKEPGARALAALIEQARREGVRVVFVQPQFDTRLAARIAEAIGGGVVAVDPLAADYADNLRSVAQQFAEALQR
jgi:zinc transport system substrate-binding protein